MARLLAGHLFFMSMLNLFVYYLAYYSVFIYFCITIYKDKIKMKNILLLVASYMMMCGNVNAQSTLKVHLEDLNASDSVIVLTSSSRDTLGVTEGKFSYEFKGTKPEMISIFNYPEQWRKEKKNVMKTRPLKMLMFPKQALQLNGTFNDYKVTGSAFYEEYNKVYASVSKEVDVRKAINEEYMKLLNAKAPREQILSKFEELKKADSEVLVRIEKYIAAHLDSEVSLYLLYKNRVQSGEKYLEKFADSIKNGGLSYMYSELADYYEYMAARKAAAAIIKEGKMAPDFLLKDINGNDFALSSLRGKYVVLDFWGSWCGWCIKGFPKMKKMYAKYSDKLEIVGIDCRDTEDKWKAAVMEQGLKWTNVINSTDKTKDLTRRYNIAGFPTKIIISPEGKIVKIIIGEKPEFYETIDKLMNK